MTIEEYKELKTRYDTLGIELKFAEFDYCDYGDGIAISKWKSKEKFCVIPEFTNYLYSNIFQNCTWLEEIDLSKSNIKVLPDRAFSELKVKRVKLNNLIKYIPKYCFYNSDIEEIIIPNSVTSIENFAFKYCTNLKRVIFEDESNLKIIKGEAFNGSGVEYFNAPDSLERIHHKVFFACENLKEVVLGPKLKVLNSNIFSYCDKLEKITFHEEAPIIKIEKYFCVGSENLKEVIFSKKIEIFCEYCFMDCSNLTNVIINKENLKSINYTSFLGTPLHLKL